ncbi:MAG: hydrogenase maturation protease [Nevskiales bacterium]|nr:hydrogenase maturation protease [Nevskiales bacterium]
MAPLRILVAGVGNPLRGDDAAGPMAIERLQARMPQASCPGVEYMVSGGETGELLGRLEACDAAILIDACVSGAEAGTIHEFDVAAGPLPQRLGGFSSHGFGVHEALELARALGQLPARCRVLAIDAQRDTHGAPVSAAVEAAVDAVVDRVRRQLQCWCTRPVTQPGVSGGSRGP